jgi:hypothetical protein
MEQIVNATAPTMTRKLQIKSWMNNFLPLQKQSLDCSKEPTSYHLVTKDPFLLPHMDQIIDSTAGCTRLSFLDAYSGSNQIKLKKEDEEKIAFITPYSVFCYQVIPFGLKNAGATYQRMMQNCLGSQIGCNIQVYIDDVVITTSKEESLISDLVETFDNLNRYKLKLNPTKCSFSVSAGQLLGFLVSARGIEENSEKIQAILTMGKPTKLHDVQKLVGRVTALNRFVARLGVKTLPFYALMKKSDDKFEWTEEADVAFTQLKKVLSTPPVLVAPNKKEPLLLYIAATHQVVSIVLVVKRSEEEKLTVSKGQYILSAKYYLLQNKGTRPIKSSYIVYSQ